jgi:D-arabinose 1-dehydrogenase-like Zn-dependent alcohol dehydrogenase
MVEISELKHDLYTPIKDIKDADAVAYAFVNEEKAIFLPYKQPKLEADQIRANVLYAGLCLSDSKTVRGSWGKQQYYPLAPGHEVIAEVSEVGENVKNFKKGDKVAFGTLRKFCEQCKYCNVKRETLCIGEPSDKTNEKFTYGYQWGGYSTQIQQPAQCFFKVSDKLKLDKASPLLCAGITVYTPIKRYAKPGMKTAVIGIGGLGHLAVQFLHKLGYEVDAITTSLEKEQFIKDLGANRVINLKDPESVKSAIRQYDFIINTSPSAKDFNNLLAFAAKAGVFCQVGAPEITDNFNINAFSLIAPEITLVGSLTGTLLDTYEMLDICAEKDIYPICETFPFEEFPQAVEKLEKGKPIFRCVVAVEEYSRKNGLFK